MATDNRDYFNPDDIQQLPNAPVVNPAGQITPLQSPNFPVDIRSAGETFQPQNIGAGPLNPQQSNRAFVGSDFNKMGIIANEANNQSNLQNQIGAIQDQSVLDQQQALARQQAMQAQALEMATQRSDQIRSRINEQSTKEVDPNHYWNSKSTGSKVLAGIGVFLSGAEAGRNTAMDQINKAIDRDIDAQKTNRDNSWKAINEVHSLNNEDWARAMHNDVFQTQSRLAGLEVVKTQLAAAGAKSQSISVQNNAREAMAKIDDDITKQRTILGQQMAAAAAASGARLDALAKEARTKTDDLSKSYVSQGYTPDDAAAKAREHVDLQFPMLRGTPYASAGQQYDASLKNATSILMKKQGLSREDAEKTARDLMNKAGMKDPYAIGGGTLVSKEDKEKAITFNGQTVIAPSKEVANKYREESQAFLGMTGALNELRKIRGENNGGTLSPDQQSRVAQLNATLIAQLGKLNQTGVMNESEVKRMSALIPDATDFNMPWKDVQARLDSLGQALNINQQARFQAYSGGNVENYRPNASKTSSGIPVPYTGAAGTIQKPPSIIGNIIPKGWSGSSGNAVPAAPAAQNPVINFTPKKL